MPHKARSEPKKAAPGGAVPCASSSAAATGQSARRLRRRWLIGLAALVTAALAAWRWGPWSGPTEQVPRAGADRFPLPAISSSPFLNTRADVAYVGSEACRACHARHDLSFRRTGMGRSMAQLDPSQEPPDGAFAHLLSKRRYQVRRTDGQLWHRELLTTDGAGETLLAEFPLKYVVGSGRHSRTYLVEVDGFLTESPVTWYASKKRWDMSPGYDGPDQEGFARPVDESCLFCHAGRVENVGGSLHKLRIVEAQISCERCHGPGALHVARQRAEADGAIASDIDYTIVNPAHLARDLAEAICQQCHLQTSATALARGRKLTDYRPGLPWQDFKHDYQLESPDSAMRVVGHVEMLHLSRCYQASPKLTCTTCHDPHDAGRKAGRAEATQSACLSCHAPERCTVDKQRRDKESPENNCVHCHMPRSPTDIPHLAFTHHKIGVHAKRPDAAPAPPAAAALKPVLDLSGLGPVERQRSLGLAYLDMGEKQRSPEMAAPYLQRALESLTAASDAGLRDPALSASMDVARFLLFRAVPENSAALTHPDLSVPERCTALYVLAHSDVLQGRFQAALTHLLQLTRLRRNAADWLLLAGCRQALGDPAAAIAALEQAVRINPRLWQAHQQLADHYRQSGNRERTAWHERRAAP
jgi:hypothetical protein